MHSMNKISERDLDEVICFILLSNGGSMPTGELRQRLYHFLDRHSLLSALDTSPLINRDDEKIDQIIRNIVSHRSRSGLIYDGFVDYSAGSLIVTQNGINLVEDLLARTI
ncbi:hypothetical protein MX101_03690 [Streptococcus uberis]|nr:hypothetical protein [Streptococcus uberis]MCK1255201.1 hypothetical protein [Streptococcus uberis]